MRKFVILSCLIFSTILLYLAFTNFTNKPDKTNTINAFRYDSTNTKIELSHFNKDFAKDKITAIGVIGSQTCASCVTELLEFSEQISRINQQFFNSSKIDKYFVVIGRDSVSAYRFRRAHNISEKTVFISFDSELGKKLYEWKNDEFLNQWIFINNRSSTITSRIPVLSRLTPLIYKKDFLNKAIFTEN